MLWRNATKIPTHPVDPTVGVLRAEDSSGKSMAVLVDYSCHPGEFGPDNVIMKPTVLESNAVPIIIYEDHYSDTNCSIVVLRFDRPAR
jgi:hypothetical protein